MFSFSKSSSNSSFFGDTDEDEEEDEQEQEEDDDEEEEEEGDDDDEDDDEEIVVEQRENDNDNGERSPVVQFSLISSSSLSNSVIQQFISYLKKRTDKVAEDIRVEKQKNIFSRQQKLLESDFFFLKKELATWDLLQRIFPPSQKKMDTEDNEDENNESLSSVSLFLSRGSDVGKVSEWHLLETAIQTEKLLRILSITRNWLSHQFDSDDSTVAFNEPLITSLPHRKENTLDTSRVLETRLFKDIWLKLRRGELEEAKSECERQNQLLLMAALCGTDFTFHEKGAKLGGNPHRDEYREFCLFLSNDPTRSSFERAIYALFSWNLPQIYQACSGWEDYVWAGVSVMLDHESEKLLSQPSLCINVDQVSNRNYCSKLPQKSLEEVFNTALNKSQDANHPFHIIQRSIIQENYMTILEMIDQKTDDAHYPSSSLQTATVPSSASTLDHLLRFAVHFVVFAETQNLPSISGLDLFQWENRRNLLLAKYVKLLIDTFPLDSEIRKHDIVCYYISLLTDSDAQIDLFADYALSISHEKERQQLFKISSTFFEENLLCEAVVEIVKRMTTIERKEQNLKYLPNFSFDQLSHPPTSNSLIDSYDQWVVSAPEWFLFHPDQQHLFIICVNSLTRRYLLDYYKLQKDDSVRFSITISQKFQAVQRCMSILNPDIDFERLKESLDNEVSEWNFFQNLLSCYQEYSQWIASTGGFLLGTGPQVRFNFDRNFDDKVIGHLIEFLSNPFEIKCQDPKNDRREAELKELKKFAIQTFFFKLHEVYFKRERFEEAIRLADLLADEETELYKHFDQESLSQILRVFQQSATEILKQSKDPFGHDKPADL